MKKLHLDAPLIIRAPKTDIDFWDYHNKAEFKDIREVMRARKYTVGKTGITYRVINHWDKNGILPEGARNISGDWRKFSLIEIVWLEAAKKLRMFGLSLERIASSREFIMKWDKKSDCYPDLEYFVVKAQTTSMNPYILVLPTGYADVGSLADIELSKDSLRHSDLLLISIKSILEGIGEEVEKARPLISLADREVVLLTKVRSKKINEVKTKVKEGEIAEIESSYVDINPRHMREIRDKTKREGMYGSITEQFEDGMQKSVRITKRQRFIK